MYSEGIQAKILSHLCGYVAAPKDMIEYENKFTAVTEAAKGGQVIIPVPHKLADSMLATFDIGIGKSFHLDLDDE